MLEANHGKTAPRKRVTAPGLAFRWPEVLAALPRSKTRESILNRVKAFGFEPSSWGSRQSLEALAHAITQTEDALDLLHDSAARRAERAALQSVRRRLERDLWP